MNQLKMEVKIEINNVEIYWKVFTVITYRFNRNHN